MKSFCGSRRRTSCRTKGDISNCARTASRSNDSRFVRPLPQQRHDLLASSPRHLRRNLCDSEAPILVHRASECFTNRYMRSNSIETTINIARTADSHRPMADPPVRLNLDVQKVLVALPRRFQFHLLRWHPNGRRANAISPCAPHRRHLIPCASPLRQQTVRCQARNVFTSRQTTRRGHST
jgi:hypothetical protein